MACNIDINSSKTVDWIVSQETSNQGVFKVMYDNFEYAGYVTINYSHKKDCSSGSCRLTLQKESKIDKCNRGESASVKTMDGYCNFHTHPLACYQGEDTLWGWPSGEDMRECVGFAMRGNLVHMVYTMEGIYTIQVNPNFTSLLLSNQSLEHLLYTTNNKQNLDVNDLRGLLVGLIEAYFKSTHGHRTREYSESFGKNPTKKDYGVCMPQDWVDYSNNFTFGNLLQGGKNSCSNMLRCDGFPDFTRKTNGTVDINNYFNQYGFDCYSMSDKGKISRSSKNETVCLKFLTENIDVVIKYFNRIPNQINFGNESWKPGQWFHVKLFQNTFFCPMKNTQITFDDWMSGNCIEQKVQTVTQRIQEYWQWSKDQFNQGQQVIFFPEVRIKFKPFLPEGSKTECSLTGEKSNQNQIITWLKGHTNSNSTNFGPNRRKKANKKRKQTKSKKTK